MATDRQSQAAPDRVFVVPELGPSLGLLVAPPPPPPGTPGHWIPLADLRLALVSGLFELAGDARRWVAEGDRELALTTLNREAWEGLWQQTVQATAERAAAAIGARLMAAAREARLPARRARTLPLDPGEVRALGARLAHGSAGLRQALDQLEHAIHDARADHAPVEAIHAWQDALGAAARRLEAAWLALEAALANEWRVWEEEVQDLRRWRRPRWPLVVTAVVLFGVAAWIGLVLGGYLPVPGPLRGIAEAVWARWN